MLTFFGLVTMIHRPGLPLDGAIAAQSAAVAAAPGPVSARQQRRRGAAHSEPSTKRRLLREAVRDNVALVPAGAAAVADGADPGDTRARAARHRRRLAMSRPAHTLPMSVLAVALVASLVYAAAPAPPPSLRAAWTHGATATWDEPAARERAPHGGAPEALPRRLARAVLPLTVKRIVLDAGHGGVHTGAVSDSGLTEKELTLDIALRLGRLLRASTAFEVLLTRDTDTTLSLQQRAAFANAARADLFVSVHVNWIPHRGIRPVETYFVGPSDDPAVLRLASLENRESGYTLAAYRHLLERVYLHARRDESQALARQVNAELFRTLAEVNPALRNWGVKTAPFAVLVGTEMPAVLVEVSCLSNEEEVDLLTTADYRDRIAAALLRGIRSYANELERVGRNEG